MTDPKPDTVISDKASDHGHRAFYLGAEKCDFPLSAADVRRLSETAGLSGQEAAYLDELIASLEQDGRLPFEWTPQEQFFLERNPEARAVPYLLYRFKFRVLPARHVVTDFPVHLLIEPTSACNLRCVMCFQSDSSFTNKDYMGMMDMGLYRDIVDQAAEGGAGAISIGSRGEPYMHKHIGEMLRYASDKKCFFDLKINTNATRLDEADCHDLLSSDVNLIALSIDANEKDLYEKIRIRGNFDTVLENVRHLRDIRARHYPDSKTEIRVSGVKFRDDQDETAFHNFWAEICDTVVFVRVQERWNTYENPTHPDRATPCEFLWNKLYVWHDGICNPCDEDYKSLLSPGNAAEQSIREIWGGEKLTRLRQHHLDGLRATYKPCDRCGV